MHISLDRLDGVSFICVCQRRPQKTRITFLLRSVKNHKLFCLSVGVICCNADNDADIYILCTATKMKRLL